MLPEPTLSLLAHSNASPPLVVMDLPLTNEILPDALSNTSPAAAPALVLRLPLMSIVPP